MSPPRSRTRTFLAAVTLTVGVLVIAVLASAFLSHADRGADPGATQTAPTVPHAKVTSSAGPPSPTSSPLSRESIRAGQPAATSPSGRSRHAPRRPRPPGTPVTPARHVFPLAGCSTSYAQSHHDYPAVDVFARRGCLFVSPVAGRVDEVNRVDRWSSSTNRGADRGGLSVSIVGVDGVRYYGSHLESVLTNIAPGSRVSPGTPLGHVGDTGSARGVGTHLHFGLSWPTPAGYWWIRRGAVSPGAFLDAWRRGRDVAPAPAVRRVHRTYGDDSRCRSYC